jgi:hypothetical protein
LTAAILAPLALESTPSAAPGPTAGAGTEVVLVHRVDGKRLDASAESELVTRVGLLADIFGRSKLRITVPRDKAAADRIVAHAVQRFGLDAERFEVATTRARGQAAATVEILSL